MLDETRVHDLLQAYLDQALTAAERTELEHYLQTSEQARVLFWEQMHLHAAAREWALKQNAGEMGVMTEGWSPSNVPAKNNRRDKERHRRLILTLTAGGIICLCFAMAGWWWLDRVPVPEASIDSNASDLVIKNTHPASVAVLALAADARWEGLSPVPGSPLPHGSLKLTQGTARIDFLCGAQMTLQAPAEVRLISEMRAELQHGSIHVFAPPAAQGFTVDSGGMSVIDRGTEFGLVAKADQKPAVHVLTGRVDVARMTAPEHFEGVDAGGGVRLDDDAGWQHFPAEPALFIQSQNLATDARQEQANRFAEWQSQSRKFSTRQDMIIHYTFAPSHDDDGVDVTVPNVAALAPADTDATLIGAERVSGRWRNKSACGFSRETDRLRFVAPGSFGLMTLMAWVRVDRLPNDFNVLLRADHVQEGSVHWQFDPLGRLRLGYFTGKPNFFRPDSSEVTEWDVAVSPPILKNNLGQWIHIASVCDGSNAVIHHYLNGERVASHALKYPMPFKIGAAQIGNSVIPQDGTPSSVPFNLVGRLDEFALLKSALSDAEIRQYYREGSP